jgi:hypothetical protein
MVGKVGHKVSKQKHNKELQELHGYCPITLLPE